VPPLAPSTTDTPVTTSPRGGRLDHLGEHGGVVRAEERSAVDEERRGARHAQRLALGEVAGHGGGDVVAAQVGAEPLDVEAEVGRDGDQGVLVEVAVLRGEERVVERPERVLLSGGARGQRSDLRGVPQVGEVAPLDAQGAVGDVALDQLRGGVAGVAPAVGAAEVGVEDHDDGRVDRPHRGGVVGVAALDFLGDGGGVSRCALVAGRPLAARRRVGAGRAGGLVW